MTHCRSLATEAQEEVRDGAELLAFMERRGGSALRAWLRHFDTNNDQHVTACEFRSGMRALGYLGDSDALFSSMDADRSGELTLQEISASEAALWSQFRSWCAGTFQGAGDMLKRFRADGEGLDEGEGRLAMGVFRAGLAEAGWSGGFEELLFESLDTEDKHSLGPEELKWLDIEKRRQRRKKNAKQRSLQESRRRPQVAQAQKAMLEEFKQFLVKKYGGLVRAWRRALSPNDQMVVQRAQFMRALADMGWHAKSRALWEVFDKDNSGIVALDELDTKSAETLAHFSIFVSETFGGAAQAFRGLDEDGSGSIKREEFVAALRRRGFRRPAKALFHGLDKHGKKSISEEDILFLDRWRPPAYLVAPPNAAAVEELKAALLARYSHYLKAWRQALDRDSSNQCNWDEFQAACQAVGYTGDVPGAWRTLDSDLSGFISLREIDQAASDVLLEFRRWADAEFGSVKAAFEVFDANRSNELAYREFRHGCRIYGFPGCAKLLFDALDCDTFGVLSLSEISFLDQWELQGGAEELPIAEQGSSVSSRAAAALRGAAHAVHAVHATRWLIGRQHDQVKKESQSLANHRLRNKIRAFDRRYTGRLRSSDSPGRDDEAAGPDLTAPTRPRGSLKDDTAAPASRRLSRPMSADSNMPDARAEDQDVDLMYKVVSCSSQLNEFPAADLSRLGGCWETAGDEAADEFVVLELSGKNPTCVNAVSLALPGTEAGPCRCQVHYSAASAEGPWKEAWSFDIPSSQLVTYQSHCDYTPHPSVVEFTDSLRRACDGGTEAAWSHVLDPDGQGRLPFKDFEDACARLQAAVGGGSPAWAADLETLFVQLVDEGSGEVTMEGLQRLREKPEPPEAAWWRLTFDSNWDGGPHIRLLGPLRLSTKLRGDVAGLASMRMALCCGSPTGTGAAKPESRITAFEIKTLGLDAETLRLRGLAKKYGLAILTLEDIHKLFRQVDSDSSGVIEQKEFEILLLQLYGAACPSDVPVSRLRFYWQQANPDGSAEIDFEEFIVWFTRYASDINPRYAQPSKMGTSIGSST